MPTADHETTVSELCDGTAADGGAANPTKPSRRRRVGRPAHDPRPLKSYAGIMASYGVLTAGLTLLLRRRAIPGAHPVAVEFALYALAADTLAA